MVNAGTFNKRRRVSTSRSLINLFHDAFVMTLLKTQSDTYGKTLRNALQMKA